MFKWIMRLFEDDNLAIELSEENERLNWRVADLETRITELLREQDVDRTMMENMNQSMVTMHETIQYYKGKYDDAKTIDGNRQDGRGAYASLPDGRMELLALGSGAARGVEAGKDGEAQT